MANRQFRRIVFYVPPEMEARLTRWVKREAYSSVSEALRRTLVLVLRKSEGREGEGVKE